MLTAACHPRSGPYRCTSTGRVPSACIQNQLPTGRFRRRGPCVLVACLFVACLVPGRALVAQRLPLRLDRPELVNRGIEGAIEKGIQYLLSKRRPGGHWQHMTSGRKSFPCANTALVGLALLANVNTPTRGPHARVVREITDLLIGYSTPNGLFSDPYRPMYSHAFALTFLSTVFGQEGSSVRRRKIREVLRKGVTLCMRTQTDEGGWGYYPNHYEDEGTLVVTQLMGLRACRDAGIPVPKSMIESGVQFIRDSIIRNSTQWNGAVRYRINDRSVRKGVTCAAVVALWNAGEYDTYDMKLIRDRVNSWIAPETTALWSYERHGEYVEYYLAQVMWIQGEEKWKRHYKQISAYLVTQQYDDGSWYGTGDSDDYGDIYATTMALLILQLPYKRLPIYQR